MWWVRFAAAQLVILIALLEVVLRFYHPVVFRVRGDEIVLPVNQTYRIEKPGSTKLDPVIIHTKNSLGFRGPEPPRDFADRLTIVTVGGSTTECLNLTDGKTWTDELARRLDASMPGIWVNNAGIDGQSTFGHRILLDSVVTRLRPTVAVFLVGANDVGLEQSNTFDLGTIPTRGRLRSFQNAVIAKSEVANLVVNFARAARARDRGFGHSEVDLRAAEDFALDSDVIEHTERKHAGYIPAYGERLRAIATLTRSSGIEPVWMTQPALFGDDADPTTGVKLARVKVNGRGNGHLEWRLLEMVNDETRRVAAEQGILLIDLARELPKDSKYFYDYLHFTNDGAARVGAIAAAQLGPHLQAKYGLKYRITAMTRRELLELGLVALNHVARPFPGLSDANDTGVEGSPAMNHVVRDFPAASDHWRTFEITTRVQLQGIEGPARAWIPLPSMAAPAYQKDVRVTWTGSSKARIEDAARDTQALVADWGRVGARARRRGDGARLDARSPCRSEQAVCDAGAPSRTTVPRADRADSR